MSDDTTSEQLAEIEGQATLQVREGRWRKRSGAEVSVSAMPMDHDDFTAAFPWWDGQETTWTHSGHLLSSGECPADLVEYLGPIEPDKTQELPTKTQELEGKTQELEGKTQELPEYTPPEGWRVLPVGERLRDGDVTVRRDGYQYPTERVGGWVGSNQRYIRPIEPQPEPEPEPQPHAATIEELRSEVSYVQNLLGTERRRVAELEELAASLRTINVAHEKAFTAAGKENTALRNQLAAVASVAADRQRLLIELDAAQQVPADSPELRQLRLDLAEATRDRDQYLDSYQRIFGDLETIRETTKAETVEAIVEWLQAFWGCNSPALALLVLEALPSIMRTIVGLNADEEIE